MEKQKVLLVSANTEGVPAPVYPLALACLAGAARRAGCEPLQFDFQLSGAENLPAFIREHKPSLVGVSIRNIDTSDSYAPRSYVTDHARAMAMVRESTKAPVVIGGSGFSIFPERIMEALGADWGIVGAGEEAFSRILAAAARGEEPLSGSGRIIAGEKGDQAAFAPPCHDPEIVRHYWKVGGMIGVQTKRGCPRRCTYCTYPLIEGNQVRFKEPAAVVDEIEQLVRDHSVRYFFLVDSVFNLCRQHDEEIAGEIVKRGLDISWGAFFSPVGLDSDYLSVLKGSGLTHVELGADSLCETMLESYRKDFTPDEALDAAMACEREGINCAIYLIFGGPGETPSTLGETLRRARALRGAVFFPFAGVRIYPGTELFTSAREKGIVADDDDCFEPRYYFEDGLDGKKIWTIIEANVERRRNWILPKDFAGYEPVQSALRQLGHKGPLWEYVAADRRSSSGGAGRPEGRKDG